MKVQEILTNRGYRYLVLDDDYNVILPIKSFLKFLDNCGKKENTLKNYATHLKLYCEYATLIQMDILSINSSEKNNAISVLSGFIYWLKYGVLEDDNVIVTSQIRSNVTVKIILDVVIEFYEYLASKGELKELEIYKKQRLNNQFKGLLFEMKTNQKQRADIFNIYTEKKSPKSITRKQYNELINACNNLRDKILIAFMFEGGTRVGETLGVQIQDLEARSNKVYIRDRRNNPNRVFVKDNSVGSFILPNYVFKWIQEYIINDISDYDSNYLFLNLYSGAIGEPLREGSVSDLFTRLSKKVGYHVNPHMCRSGFATERSLAGWDIKMIQNALRHKQIKTTAIYIDVLSEVEMDKTVEFYKSKGIEIGGLFK
ncbi:MAG: tyrosine-type recombinase/integrase [Anaerocolumna aminovalerica]|uniref:tyrosine-type recombinase/integrase n=1 Tax=Anaerocolumna aminovalerica TaxID=1527 RepID=UPI002914A06D|nr:tyrosine-type recombinase/integrase [Anaerocolumna aminovalerica]MDU6266255.1 tyrosine-type recombinase/integrase [Anaerocolumna aminovalerica]